MGKVLSIFGNRDPREVPLYTIGQAAHHMGVPSSTVRAWAIGQPYLASQGRRGEFSPLIHVPQTDPARLSFNNLAELFMLATLRKEHELNLTAIRNAIANVKRSTGSKHPLLTAKFATDGVRLYLEQSDEHLLDISGRGQQYAIVQAVKFALRRIERSEDTILRYYPLIEGSDARPIVIDPELSFGKPTVTGSRVAVEVVADFVKAGESASRVAREFGIDESAVKAAVKWQFRDAA